MNGVEITQQIQEELLKWLQNTGSFVAEQAPDVANQIIAFGFWSNAIECVLFSLMLVLCMFGCYKAATCNDNFADWLIPVGMFSAVGGFLSLMLACFCGHQAIMAYVAPKLYLLHYLAQLAK